MATAWGVATDGLRGLLNARCRDESDPVRWAEESAGRPQLRGWSHAACRAIDALAAGTVRASSLVENLNSRLRTYFSLRRHLGADYLDLLRFYLNHRVLERSERPERQGRTSAELLTGTGARALAGATGLPSLRPRRVIRGLVAVAPSAWLAQARGSSAP